MMPARKSNLGKRKNIPRPIPLQPQISTVHDRLGTDTVRTARKSMLGKRKNIPRPIPVQLPFSTVKHHLGMGPVKRQECVNLPRARRELWATSEELLIRNQKNKDQDCGAQKKKRRLAGDACNIVPTAVCRDSVGLRFENDFHTTVTSQIPKESVGLCKTFAVSNSEGTRINYMHEASNCSKTKRTVSFRDSYTKSEFYEKSASDRVDVSKYLMPQKLKSCIRHNKSEESSKLMSPEGTSEVVSNKISTFAYEDTFAVSAATQTDFIVKNNTAIQTDSVICAKSGREKLFALVERLLKHKEQLDATYKKHKDEMHALQNQTNIIHNEVVNILKVFSNVEEVKINSDIMFKEWDNHSSGEQSGYRYNHKDSEECSRTPLRRSARIAAQTTFALAAGNKSLPSTPAFDGVANYPSAKSVETCSAVKMNKPESVYKELCSNFHFLKTPQSTKPPLAKTLKATPNEILKQRLKAQILSLYD